MNSESARIADQLRRAFMGDAWHGSSLSDLLAGIGAERASVHPLAGAHSIWEIVLHIEIYVRVALEAAGGTPMPRLFGTEKDWPPAAGDWQAAATRLFETAGELGKTIESFADRRLLEIVPGRGYNFYHLFHGIVQHSLYHGGQIALLRLPTA